MRACKCAGTDLNTLPLKCESVTIKMFHDARSEEGEIGRLCYREDMEDYFDHLPIQIYTEGPTTPATYPRGYLPRALTVKAMVMFE